MTSVFIRFFTFSLTILFKLRFYRSYIIGLVAQSVEQRTENPCVGGSIPSQATILVVLNLIIIE